MFGLKNVVEQIYHADLEVWTRLTSQATPPHLFITRTCLFNSSRLIQLRNMAARPVGRTVRMRTLLLSVHT